MNRTRRASAPTVDGLEPRRLFATYYVAPTGSDSNGTGSAAHPFATLQFAGALARPGDTVDVESGSYAGAVFGWDSTPASAADDIGIIAGTAAAPITLQADPAAAAGSVIIDTRDRESADGIDLEPGCDSVIIKGFTVDNTDGSITRAGIRVAQSDGVQVLDNTVHDAGTWGIFTAFGSDLVINGNTATDSQSQHGIYVSNSAVDPTIVGNTCYGNAECGIELNGDASQGGSGVITGALIENNVLFNNGLLGGSTINCDGVTSSTIENNLLFNNHASGISLFQEDGATGSTGNVVANNTIDMAADARWDVNINSGSTGNTVFDNILLNQSPDHGDILIDSSSKAGFTSNDNVTDGRFDLGDGSAVMTLAQWRAATHQDAGSITATESQLFRSATDSDFSLSSASPADAVGVASLAGHDAPPTDLTGATRTTGTAGAYAPGSAGGVAAAAAPPTAPVALHAVTHPGDIALTWTDTTAGAASFEVQELVAVPPAGGHGKVKTAFGNIALVAAGTTSYDLTGLSPSHKYTLRIEAVGAGGIASSKPIAAATKRLPRPLAPIAVVAVATDATDVALSWTDSAAATDLLTGFRIYRRRTLHGRGGRYVVIGTTDAGTFTFTDSTAAAGSTYQYRVAAVNRAGATVAAPAVVTTPTG